MKPPSALSLIPRLISLAIASKARVERRQDTKLSSATALRGQEVFLALYMNYGCHAIIIAPCIWLRKFIQKECS